MARRPRARVRRGGARGRSCGRTSSPTAAGRVAAGRSAGSGAGRARRRGSRPRPLAQPGSARAAAVSLSLSALGAGARTPSCPSRRASATPSPPVSPRIRTSERSPPASRGSRLLSLGSSASSTSTESSSAGSPSSSSIAPAGSRSPPPSSSAARRSGASRTITRDTGARIGTPRLGLGLAHLPQHVGGDGRARASLAARGLGAGGLGGAAARRRRATARGAPSRLPPRPHLLARRTAGTARTAAGRPTATGAARG